MRSKFYKFNLKFYLIFFISSIILILHSFYYLPFLSDDGLISLQYAKRFLHGKGLTWTDGIPVEGYTNLLWILLISFFGLFGLDLIFITRFLGIVLNIAVLFILIKTAEKINKDKKIDTIPVIIALLFYSFSGTIAAWSIGGLEQPLLNFLFAISIYFTLDIFHKENLNFKEIIKPGIFLGLMCLTRPDSFLFVLCFTIVFIIKKFNKRNVILTIGFILPAIILLGSQLIFRIFYYNDIIPNSAYIKLDINKMMIKYGIDYILKAFNSIIHVLFFAFFIFYTKKQYKIIILLFLSLILWLIYLIIIGGDIFPAYRHFNIIIVIFSFIILFGINEFSAKLNKIKNVKFIIYPLLFILLIFYLKGQFEDKLMQRAKSEKWEWDGKEIALILKNYFNKEKPLIATSAAGCIPYWSDLPVVDTIGLNDFYITRYSKKNILERRIAHGFGDGYYILSREPDIILFCGPWGSAGPCFTSEAQLYDTIEFKENYTPAIFRIDKYNKKINSIMWIKNYGKIGVRNVENMILIPAYLLDNTIRNYIYPGRDDKFIIKINKERPAIFNALTLQENIYLIKTEPDISGTIEIKDLNKEKKITGYLPFKFKADFSKYEIKIIPEKEYEIMSLLIEKL